jgi:hypothetical protein
VSSNRKPTKAKPSDKEKTAAKKALSLLSLVPVLTLAYSFTIGRPVVDYVSLQLLEPLSPGGPFLPHGKLKNFGSTTARDYSVETMLGSWQSDQKVPFPGFTKRDAQGQIFHRTVHDLAPGQEDEIVPADTRGSVTPDAYRQLIEGKRNVFFFSRIRFKDLLFFPHTKNVCHKLLVDTTNMFGLCSQDDYYTPSR